MKLNQTKYETKLNDTFKIWHKIEPTLKPN